MKPQNYSSSISVNLSPQETLERISRVSDWWTASVTGSSRVPGDKFGVRWGETFVDFEVAEMIPDERVVWLVTDCNLAFITDKTEWKNTKVVWDLSQENGKTRVTMTHVGLVPGVECYANCEAGWNFYFTKSLLKLLTEGKGLPDGRRAGSGQTEAA